MTATAKTDAGFDPIRTHVEMLRRLAAGIDGVLVVSVFHASTTGDKDAPGTVTHHAVGDVTIVALPPAVADRIAEAVANVAR